MWRCNILLQLNFGLVELLNTLQQLFEMSQLHAWPHYLQLSSLGNTGSIKLPNEESCEIKNPVDWAFAVCRVLLCAEFSGCASVLFPPIGEGSAEELRVEATPCFRRSCFFNCSSSKILRFVSSGWEKAEKHMSDNTIQIES